MDVDNVMVQEMVQFYVVSLYMLIRNFFSGMIWNKVGVIVVVSFIWGEIGVFCEVLYSMVKGVQYLFVKGLVKELVLSGIRVNVVVLGVVDINMMN